VFVGGHDGDVEYLENVGSTTSPEFVPPIRREDAATVLGM